GIGSAVTASKLGPEVTPEMAELGKIAEGEQGVDVGGDTTMTQPKEEPKGNCSFAPGTPVLMADFTTKAIKDVHTGDKVWATDPETGLSVAEPVTQLHDNQDTDLSDLTVATSHGIAVIHTTQNHLIWNLTTREWTAAGDLPPGAALYAID